MAPANPSTKAFSDMGQPRLRAGWAKYALAEANGVRCFPASADVTDPDAVDRLVMHAEQHVGTIDMVVNTVAGCVTDALMPTMRPCSTTATWKRRTAFPSARASSGNSCWRIKGC